MKKMAKMYAAEELMKQALPVVKQQFKQFTGSGKGRKEGNYDYQYQQQPYGQYQPPPYQQQHYQPPPPQQQDYYQPPPHQQDYYQPPPYQQEYHQPPHQQGYYQPGQQPYGYQPSGSQSYQNGNKKNEIVDTISNATRAAGKAASSACRKVKNMVDAESLKGMLKDGNIVQLVSLNSGRTLQILQSESGQLILDGQGGIGNQFFNAHFHVSKDPVDHGLRLHNQFNYLAVVNGTVTLINQDGRQKAHPATRFKVKAEHGNSIQFESVHHRRRFIEVTPNGKVRSTENSSQDSPDAQFSINIICKV